MTRLKRIATLSVTAALVLSGCGGSETDSAGDTTAPTGAASDAQTSTALSGKGPKGSGPAPDAVTIAIRRDIDSFDPHTSLGDSGAQQAFLFLYDSMVHRSADGEILPGIASAWEMSPTKGVFTIRDGLTCADGTPLDAAAVAASFSALGSKRADSASEGSSGRAAWRRSRRTLRPRR